MDSGSLSRARASTHTPLGMTRQDRMGWGKEPTNTTQTAEASKCPLMSAAELGNRTQSPAVPLGGTALLLLNPSIGFHQLISRATKFANTL